jgi:hypothetical protein
VCDRLLRGSAVLTGARTRGERIARGRALANSIVVMLSSQPVVRL